MLNNDRLFKQLGCVVVGYRVNTLFESQTIKFAFSCHNQTSNRFYFEITSYVEPVGRSASVYGR